MNDDDRFDALDAWAERNADHSCLMCGGQFLDLDEWYDATDGVCAGCVVEAVEVQVADVTLRWPLA